MVLATPEARGAAERLNDTALMDRLAQREESALEQLYERYARPLYSLLLRITREASVAEELLQDVFLQLWHNAPAYQATRGPLEPWLYTLARNRALDRMRLKSERQRRRELSADLILAPATSPNPEQWVDSRLRAEKVRALVGSLPARQRQALELAFFEGMTHSEIARTLKEPLGTVKTWIRSALLRLGQELEGAH